MDLVIRDSGFGTKDLGSGFVDLVIRDLNSGNGIRYSDCDHSIFGESILLIPGIHGIGI